MNKQLAYGELNGGVKHVLWKLNYMHSRIDFILLMPIIIKSRVKLALNSVVGLSKTNINIVISGMYGI